MAFSLFGCLEHIEKFCIRHEPAPSLSRYQFLNLFPPVPQKVVEGAPPSSHPLSSVPLQEHCRIVSLVPAPSLPVFWSIASARSPNSAACSIPSITFWSICLFLVVCRFSDHLHKHLVVVVFIYAQCTVCICVCQHLTVLDQIPRFCPSCIPSLAPIALLKHLLAISPTPSCSRLGRSEKRETRKRERENQRQPDALLRGLR